MLRQQPIFTKLCRNSWLRRGSFRGIWWGGEAELLPGVGVPGRPDPHQPGDQGPSASNLPHPGSWPNCIQVKVKIKSTTVLLY
jgi:hypothetical protein